MASDFVKAAKQVTHRAAAHLVGAALRSGAVYNSENFKLWEKRGYHITPLHFYSPIPDTRELEKRVFKPSACPGIDFRAESQLRLMKDDFTRFAPEYNALPVKPAAASTFYLENDAFLGIDPLVYYAMIRHFKPQTIVEVGSGHSTVLGAQTCRLNGSTRYVCIDPWPRDFIARGISGIEFIRSKVEDLAVDLFEQLQPNDILFVDSSHVVRTASDVCYIILEVLPRLKPGVIVHFHDIFLPFEYPKEWMVDLQRFWNEQYLLQAYLAENSRVEILFANHFLSQTYPQEVRQAFPQALWMDGASLWLRKR